MVAPAFDIDPTTLVAVQLVILAGVPAAFVLAVLRGGYARTGEVEELGAWLGSQESARPGLEEALGRALGDDSLRLLFPSPRAHGRLVDSHGRASQLSGPDSRRAAVDVELRGRPIASIDYDPMLVGDAELVRTAGRVVAVEVDRERLVVELRASEDALLRSRERLVEAADRERRRIAQDLHDGLQAQLVLLALSADGIARDPTSPESTRCAAAALRRRLDAAAEDLRQLVHSMMPALLIERGLYAAVGDLVDHIPVRTSLELAGTDEELSSTVEMTAYYVVAEAVTNALKHSDAHRLSIRLHRGDQSLDITVRDDGAGGASTRDGAGLRSLTDRLDVLGGVLTVESSPESGTHVHAVVPCAS